MRHPRSIYLLQLLLLALHFVAAALVFPNLPERFPIHFDLAGNADRWAGRSLLTWFTLPIVSVVVGFGLYGLSLVAARTPQLWNIPRKEEFLSLAPEQRAPIESVLQGFLASIGVLVSLLFFGVHVMVYLSAIGAINNPAWPAMMLVFGPVVVLLVMAVRLWRRIDGEIQRVAMN